MPYKALEGRTYKTLNTEPVLELSLHVSEVEEMRNQG